MVKQYKEDGAVLLKGVFSPKWIDLISEGIVRYFSAIKSKEEWHGSNDIGIILLCNIVSVFIVYRRILRHLGKASKRKVSIVLIAMMRNKCIIFIIPNGTYIHNMV